MPATHPTIILETDEVLVVDKPAGLLSQRDHTGVPSLVEWARAYLHIDDVGVMHRLDRNVSGLVLIAKTSSFAANLNRQMQCGTITRSYIAIAIVKRTRAAQLKNSFAITAPLLKNPKTNLVRIDMQHGEPALTRVRVLQSRQALAGIAVKLAVDLVTGRSHQIRVHLASEHLPIAGDPKYGIELQGLDRPLLHAYELAFVDAAGQTHTVVAPLPFALTDVLALRVRRQNL